MRAALSGGAGRASFNEAARAGRALTNDAAPGSFSTMRLIFAAAASAFVVTASPASATCFRDCLGGKIQTQSDDQQIRDAAKECRQTCEAQVRDGLERDGKLAALDACKAEPLSKEDLKKLRAETPSYYVQSNTFIWDFKNPFPDRILTKVRVTAQNMDLNQIEFTGAGIAPPAGEGVFVIPAFFDGYPAVRFAAKVEEVWACPVK